jgi:hypothetical protein
MAFDDAFGREKALRRTFGMRLIVVDIFVSCPCISFEPFCFLSLFTF